ncbi:MAG: hypothetical protein QM784_24695 [Polyangiaceae bacterium]
MPQALGFCVRCRSSLEGNAERELGDVPLLAPYRFAGPMTRAVHRLKYEERSEYARRLAADIAFTGHPSWLNGVSLVPVPIHPERLVERGYDQAGLLARALGRRWRLPVEQGLLHRVRFVARQVGLDRAARLANVQGAFEARFPVRRTSFTRANTVASRAFPPRVALVDDVVTTGATIRACMGALEAVHIEVAGVVAVARAVGRN